ncbi:GCN5-related N-acetyltransferase [Streptomyces ambofaciens ATCC 23877]|uniref:GCN5-related N-acetyltransferase n=1 Tax=Streptomyces ambofaciens (strain ATCC 23877 / 3486 / DSM 40053 / JCM 4204 / NBRC 12836 / NRRL B-2516) TaxID=278992 RepID=A0A0K2B2G8_STRA7|nr:GNAT family N-acetyltransferase [Streptomyces ambofaciens]AKZ59346.1 GCN5-related N-acetyltransferase [Streptomyces ambofaciens ATCC 23877]
MSLRITPLTDPSDGPRHRRLAWLASDAEGHPVGSAFLRLPTDAGRTRLAELSLHVHPVERRGRVGTRLLDAAVAAARDDSRRGVVAHTEAGTPGDHFLSARGFRTVLTLRYARLSPADVDAAALDEIVERPHPGYLLTSWEGVVPDDLARTFAASRRAMDDMPMDDADHDTAAWDVDRVRAVAKAVADRGDLLHTVVAIDTSDDSIAGFTELVVPGDRTGDAEHYGTAVLPEHRGHGLARWMKAESIRRACAEHPRLGGLVTDTAESNTYMRRVNDDLGYAPTHTTLQYQLDL